MSHLILLAMSACIGGCVNPFAPPLGSVGSRIWSDQSTAGELLENFELSYDYQDSIRYADCLDESFIFQYYDEENGRSDHWFLDTDLKATGGLFNSFDRIDLEWVQVPEEVVQFDYPDSTLSFITRFHLTLAEEAPILGFARFEVRQNDDGKFRVISWRDDF
ncbi:hypothetical protein ACFLQV_03525 [Calditrichota bacterium]